MSLYLVLSYYHNVFVVGTYIQSIMLLVEVTYNNNVFIIGIYMTL